MSKTARFINGNRLQELPDMKEPRKVLEAAWGWSDKEKEIFYSQMGEYQKQLAACRIIPAPDCKFKVGEVYEEGKDYEIVNQNWPSDKLPAKPLIKDLGNGAAEFPTWIAVPILYGLKGKLLMTCNPKKNWLKYNYIDKAEESQDELWDEFVSFLNNYNWDVGDGKFYFPLSELKSKFHITRK